MERELQTLLGKIKESGEFLNCKDQADKKFEASYKLEYRECQHEQWKKLNFYVQKFKSSGKSVKLSV